MKPHEPITVTIANTGLCPGLEAKLIAFRCVNLTEDTNTKGANTMNFNITAGTIARTAVLLLALTNQLLSAMGKSPLPIESATVEQLVTAGITSIAALIAWWKNNSFTKEAIAADAEYDRLRKQNGK